MSEAMVRRGGGGKKEGRYGWKKYKTGTYLASNEEVDGPSDGQNGVAYYISDTISVDKNLEIELINPTSYYNGYSSIGGNAFNGKYYAQFKSRNRVVYRGTSDFYKGKDNINMNCVSWLRETHNPVIITTKCVVSDDINEFPADGKQDGWYYLSVVT